MENPEAMLDVLSMETFRQRFAVHTNNGQSFHTNSLQFPEDDDQLENIVRDLCIDDSIAGCFEDSECDVKDTFDLKAWLPNPKEDATEFRNFPRTNIGPSDTLASPTISDKNPLSLHGLNETRWKKPFSQSTDGRPNIDRCLANGSKVPCKPAPSPTDNLLDKTSTDRSHSSTFNIFRNTSVSNRRVTSGVSYQRNLPFGASPETASKGEMCNQSIPQSQRTRSVEDNSDALQNKGIGTFGGKYTECTDGRGRLKASTGSSSSSVPTALSQSLNIDTQPKRSVFQRMALKTRMERKRIQYQDQGLIPTDKSYTHSKNFPLPLNELSSGSYQTEIISVKDQNAHCRLEKMNFCISSLNSDPQVSQSKDNQRMSIPEEDFAERVDSISFENCNPNALGSENPEPYVLPSFQTTSEESTTSGIFGSELSFNSDGFQGTRQAFRKAIVSHHPPDDILEPTPENLQDAKKRKHPKPWYDVDDRQVSSKSHLNKNQDVNLRAVIEESARVISPELDTPSDDPVDERISAMNESKPSLSIPVRDDENLLTVNNNDSHLLTGHHDGFNYSPPRKIASQNIPEVYAADGCNSSYRLDHVYANVHSAFSPTNLHTSITSNLNVISTSVSSSMKTFPSLIPIITNTPSNIDAIPTYLPAISNVISPLAPPVMKDFSRSVSASTNTIDTSVSSCQYVISTSVPPRSNVTYPLIPATSKSVSFLTNQISTSSPFNTFITTTSAVYSVNTAKPSASSTSIVTTTSDCLNVRTIPKSSADYSETSLQLINDGTANVQTVTNAGAINEFNEQLRAHIYRDEKDVLRSMTLSGTFSHATDWKYEHEKDFTPYHLAIQLGRLECLHILLESQPLLDRYGWDEGLGLDLAKEAVKSNQVQCLLLLHDKMDSSIAKGPLDREDNTLMHMAASLNHTDVTVALLSLGHDVNKENKAGLSPLKLCLQHFALSKDIDLLKNSQPDLEVIDTDCSEPQDKKENLIKGENSSNIISDTLPSLDFRTGQINEHATPNVHDDALNAPCPSKEPSVSIEASDKRNDTIDGTVVGQHLPVNSDAESLEKANGQDPIMNLILTELMMRLTSKTDENCQRSPTGDLFQRSLGTSDAEAYIRQYMLKYAKSLQESQKGILQSCKDKENHSRGHNVKSKQLLAKTEEGVEEGVFTEKSCSVDSDFIKKSARQVQKVDNLSIGNASAQNGDARFVEQNKVNQQGSRRDCKSGISSHDSRSKEVDSFCISSDELYNSPPDKIPSVPIRPRSSRQPHSIRTRPVHLLNTMTADSTKEVKPHIKTHERDKLRHLEMRQDFKNHKSRSHVSYLLDSSSTSQDPSEDRQEDYLTRTNPETSRHREARGRRWGGLSLLPHHLKKKIERLSQKGKRKTVSGGISGSSNSSSSIVTSSSSSGGRGDQSAEGGSSVRAIVDFRDSGQDRQYFNGQSAPSNQRAPIHVNSIGIANLSSPSNRTHASHDVRDSRDAEDRTHIKHDTEMINNLHKKGHHSETRDSDEFWRSTDTFSSLTTLSEDNDINVIKNIGDICRDDGHDNVRGFYDVHQSRSHRRHHRHSYHHHRRSRSSEQSERDRYYHNHRGHHRRRRREALGCSPSRRKHYRPYNGSDDNTDIDEEDNDTDEEEETDMSDDPRVRVNVDNEEWPDEMLRVQRLAKHLESVQRLQTGNSQVIETVITGTGEVLASQEDGPCDANHVNIGEAYPFSSHDSKGKRMPLHTKRTSSPSGLVGRRAKIHLFNHEKLNTDGDAKANQKEVAGFGTTEATAAERCREMDRDVPWDLLTFSDSEDTDFGELNSR